MYHYFNIWSKNGTWERANTLLREKARRKENKNTQPTAAIIDSQSVKNIDNPCVSGYDAGKNVNGVKRHIAVDTLGFLLALVVHAANVQDRDGAKGVFKKLKRSFQGLKKIFADQSYAGTLIAWVKKTYGFVLEVVKRKGKGFVILPKRWIVERTFGWFGKARRLSKNYEATTRNAEAMVYVTMIHLMTKRLAGSG